MKSLFVEKWIAIAVLSVAAVGCKQGQGERCQVDADCADGLSCSQAEPKTCGGDKQGQVDAETPPQDAEIDAKVFDAAHDATP